MAGLPTIPCVILAGGDSTRFGSPKGLAKLGGKPLVQHAVERLQKQTIGPVAINAPDEDPYAFLGNEIVPDILDSQLGPISGIYTAICWAESRGFENVITVPVDCPFFPNRLVARLASAGCSAVAEHDERPHFVFGFWPVTLAASLRNSINQGVLALHKWTVNSGVKRVSFNDNQGADPFFNINTQADLEAASARLEFPFTAEFD